MNFFEHQARSRRASRWLVLLFAMAVLAVVSAVDLVVFTLLRYFGSSGDEPAFEFDSPLTLVAWLSAHPGTAVLVTLLVLGVIAVASLYKTIMLGGGGSVVATALGGMRVPADTSDPAQRRLLNVVEEMAIASGVPVPEVYVLEHEQGINAFAAGHNPANAAIGITRGALTHLNRAELQGVIAHEFSHILNGDMRLNLRMMGLLFGLLVIALIGRTILRLAGHARTGNRRGGGQPLILLVALALVIIGYLGLFFGRVIQAAVSRMRESLADASAVQFTRDPGGLRGALLKISAASSGSRLRSVAADEVAHMLFAPGMRRLFATHPSLLRRLKAIDPQFDPRELEAARARMIQVEIAQDAARARARAAAQAHAAGPKTQHGQRADVPAGVGSASQGMAGSMTKLGNLIQLGTATPAAVAQLVGNPGTAHMQLARRIREALPEALTAAGSSPESARALLLALALDTNEEPRRRQLAYITRQLGAPIATEVQGLMRTVDGLDPEQRLPALLRSFPALHQLAREDRLQLMTCLQGMLQREGRLSLRSYVLRKLAQVQLHDDLAPRARLRSLPLHVLQDDARVLFSALAEHGHEDESAARRAYEAGMQVLYPRGRPDYGIGRRWGAELDRALSRLDRLMPSAKEQLVEAMVRTVSHDEQVTLGEAELLRTVCASLHCPLPPLLAMQTEAAASSSAL